MKFKLKEKRRRDERLLVGEGTKTETLDYADAEYMRRERPSVLLPMEYTVEQKPRFEFRADGMQPVDDMLKAPVESDRFRAMLRAFLDLVKLCDEQGMPVQRVLFDLDKLFYDPGLHTLRFAYVPINSFAAPGLQAGEAVARICVQARLADDADAGLARGVADHVRRTPYLSAMDYESLLTDLGVLVASTTPEEGRSDVEYGLDTGHLEAKESYGFSFAASYDVSQPDSGEEGRAAVEEAHTEVLQDIEGDEDSGYRLVDVDSGALWSLRSGENRIGRLDSCDVTIHGVKGVSRQHALLTVSGDDLVVRDLCSTNGVKVNGARIVVDADADLEVDDLVTIGTIRLRVERVR